MVGLGREQSLLSKSQPPPEYLSKRKGTELEIARLVLGAPPPPTYQKGSTPPPGDPQLLGYKAIHFPQFSYSLLNRTIAEVQKLAPIELKGREIPEGLKPVTLTAIMKPNGHLTEILIDQRSGIASIDKLFVDACKNALWSRNPPRGALSRKGDYRLQIQGALTNYSYDRAGRFTYVVHLGLAIL